MKSDTFIEISNKDIYNKLLAIEKQVSSISWLKAWLGGITASLIPIFIFVMSIIIK